MIGKVSQIEQLNQLLQQAQVRHQLISTNIANVNTPNYKTRDVTFKGNLDEAQKAVYQDAAGLVERPDGNNVDVDREMSALTKNSLKYQTYTQILASKLAMMRTAITGR